MNQADIMRKVLRVDGTVELLERRHSIGEISELINSDCSDSFMLVDGVHVCIIDDNGIDKGLPVNVLATALYHQRSRGIGEIYGDAVVVPDFDFGGAV
ncbi:DUF3846 domain-containing protein [Pararobbsia alpina]|uniref:hypothetical protein n=1 Tax=Pararobbsia alpina TaxID=621374 RepID=UPI0039A747E2